MSLFDLASRLARPALFSLSPERAHKVMMHAMKAGAIPNIDTHKDDRLQLYIGGIDFPNPLGLAAGCDKNAEAPDAFLKLGFGFAEIGTLTPRAQSGNPKPRIFRLTQDEAIINRLGFNNQGHTAALERLKQRSSKGGIVGVNIGANKDSDDFVEDYEKGLEIFYDVADYFTMNISSPNTPGLRNLQMGTALETMLERAFKVANEQAQKTQKNIPIFLKIAPDLETEEMDEIASVINTSKLDGVIISNTTLDRDGLKDTKQASEAGGLSGKPLFRKSTLALAKMRKKLNPALPIIGVGGVSSSQDVIAKMEAGADLVQLYTGLVFGGPLLPSKIIRELSQYLDVNKLDHISQLTGSKTDEWIQEND